MSAYPHPVLMPANALHAPEVGARLRALREARELSREHVAAEFRQRTGEKTATNTVARWESTGSLKVQELIEMAALLEADPAWILLGEDRDLLDAVRRASDEDRRRRERGDESELAG